MSDTQTTLLVLFVLAFAAIMGGVAFSPIFKNRTASNWKAQIVRHGCGDFAITDTLTGETEFQWRKP